MAPLGAINEFYMNCAAIDIVGEGIDTLKNYPDMFVGGPLVIANAPNVGKDCQPSPNTILKYPNPGSKVTTSTDPLYSFFTPTGKKCYAGLSSGSESGSSSGSESGKGNQTQIPTSNTIVKPVFSTASTPVSNAPAAAEGTCKPCNCKC